MLACRKRRSKKVICIRSQTNKKGSRRIRSGNPHPNVLIKSCSQLRLSGTHLLLVYACDRSWAMRYPKSSIGPLKAWFDIALGVADGGRVVSWMAGQCFRGSLRLPQNLYWANCRALFFERSPRPVSYLRSAAKNSLPLPSNWKWFQFLKAS